LDYTAKAMLEMSKFGRGYENLDIQTLGLLSAESESINRTLYTVVSKSQVFRTQMALQYGSWANFRDLPEGTRITEARAFATEYTGK
jgi:hypothetical protein